jgi:IclR family pca regulon transcriptional regulator
VSSGDATRETATSRSLERGLAILLTFSETKPLLGVSEVARAVGLSRSSAHRYVATLTKLGYLEQDAATRRYRLGLRVVDLGFSAINSMELRQIAAPTLQELSDSTGHTVNMAVLDGVEVLYVERCRSSSQGQRDIDLNLHVGSRMPAYCTSMGKALLAWLPPDDLEARVARIDLVRRGPNTLTSREDLLEELAHVRRDGLAVNNEELSYGLRSIGVPIRARSGEVVAAINLAVHRSLVSMEDLRVRLGPVLKTTGRAISQRAGYRPTAG